MVSYDDVCRLSRIFGQVSDLRTWQDQRINEWLKEQTALALARGDARKCTCPVGEAPEPCQQKFALQDCLAASLLRAPEAAPGWQPPSIEDLETAILRGLDKAGLRLTKVVNTNSNLGMEPGYALARQIKASITPANLTASTPSAPSVERAGNPDMPNLSLCSFQYLADEMKRRGATVTPAPHGGDFASDQPAPSVDSGVSEREKVVKLIDDEIFSREQTAKCFEAEDPNSAASRTCRDKWSAMKTFKRHFEEAFPAAALPVADARNEENKS